MWYRIIPKSERDLRQAEKRLKAHGYEPGVDYIERVHKDQISGKWEPENRDTMVDLYIMSTGESQETVLRILLGDLCEITTVNNLFKTKNVQDAISELLGQYPDLKK